MSQDPTSTLCTNFERVAVAVERIADAMRPNPADARLAAVRAYAETLPDSLGIVRRDLIAICDGEG